MAKKSISTANYSMVDYYGLMKYQDKGGIKCMDIRELPIPEDTIFFNLFERHAGLVTGAAWQPAALTEDFTGVKERHHAIENLGHEEDQITHDIREQLNRTFITTLDPEEISHPAPTLNEARRTTFSGLQRRCVIISQNPPICI